MENKPHIDQVITEFIYLKPEIVAKILKSNGYSLPSKLTLPIITEKTFNAIYEDENKKFISDLGTAIDNPEFANIIPLIIGAVVAITSALISAKAARKARQSQERIFFAQMAQARFLEEERIRTGAETERTRILLNTLQQYQSDLQTQSTQRIKDVWIYTGMIAVSIGIIYGLSILLTPSKN